MVSSFEFVYAVDHVYGFPFIEPSLHPWDKAYFTMISFLVFVNFPRWFWYITKAKTQLGNGKDLVDKNKALDPNMAQQLSVAYRHFKLPGLLLHTCRGKSTASTQGLGPSDVTVLTVKCFTHV